MRRHISIFLLLITTILQFSCNEREIPTIPVNSITIDATAIELTVGDYETITATVNPSNASNKNVYWTSSDQTVAKVDNTGKITAVKAGTATVTVITEDGGKTATCKVTVNEKIYPVTGVTLDKNSVELTEGDVTVLTATVNPSNASNKNIYWTSSDQTVAIVDNTGKITAVKAGTATVTVTTEDGEKTATCKVTVNEKIYPVTGVTLDKNSVELTEGDVTIITATVNPSNASNKNIYWTSSDSSVATVDNSGKITAVKAGEATITVTTEDGGKTATCKVTVNEKIYPVTGVTLDKTYVELTEGDVTVLTATVNPSNASNKNVYWTSSDQTVATVDNTGKITAVKAGTATVTVTTEDGGKTATCKVTVNEKIYPVTGVTLDKNSVELTEGDVTVLTATVNPSNASNKNVYWTSSDSAVATVDNTGKVTAVKAGSATITVTTEDGGKTATCKVTVKEKIYPVTGVTLDKTSVELTEGDVIIITATVNPSNASNKNVYWTSSDSAVATVDNTGKVTAVKVGSATITVTSEDGGKTATCKVTVKEKIYPVTGVTLDKTSVELTEGDATVLTATVNPSNASNKNVYWTSSDSAVATVDNTGKVTAVKVGTATITVTSEDGGKTATCKVTVKEKIYPVTGVTLDKTSVELTEGDVIVITATVNPSNASNKKVYWTSSDSSVATVDNTGKVTAVKVGSATITVTSEDGGKTATCKVTVKEKIYPVTGVTLDKTSVELTEGDVIIITATVNPSNASNKKVYWTSSDSAVATVDNAGKVTAVKAGSATITVTTEDGGKTATCKVTVKEKIYPVTGVTLDKTSVELTEGDVIVITATVNPSNASNKKVYWTSSDSSVATVDNTGKVTAVKVGSATITVTSEDGGKTATCKVTVKGKIYPVTGVTLDKTSVELTEGDVIVITATVNPSNASNKKVYWTSSDSAVATVDNTGKVTAVKRGKAVITVTTEDGNKTATCTITVIKPSHGVDIGDWEGNGSDDGGIAS